MQVSGKAWNDCVRAITIPFGDPAGIWNRLEPLKSSEGTDYAEMGGEDPKGKTRPP